MISATISRCQLLARTENTSSECTMPRLRVRPCAAFTPSICNVCYPSRLLTPVQPYCISSQTVKLPNTTKPHGRTKSYHQAGLTTVRKAHDRVQGSPSQDQHVPSSCLKVYSLHSTSTHDPAFEFGKAPSSSSIPVPTHKPVMNHASEGLRLMSLTSRLASTDDDARGCETGSGLTPCHTLSVEPASSGMDVCNSDNDWMCCTWQAMGYKTPGSEVGCYREMPPAHERITC